MEKILKFLRFEPWKQALLLQAFAVQLGVRLALAVLPFYKILIMLQRIQAALMRSPQGNQIGTDRYISGSSFAANHSMVCSSNQPLCAGVALSVPSYIQRRCFWPQKDFLLNCGSAFKNPILPI